MSELDPVRSRMIVAALQRKGVAKACPRCGTLHFSVVAETLLQINSDPTKALAGYVLPTVVVACNNCGFLTQHALGPLDIPAEDVAHAG